MMSERLRRVGVVSALLGGVVLLSFGCSSTKKESALYAGEGGEGGSAPALEAGAAGTQPDGAAGRNAQPEAGQGGTADNAGAAGAPSDQGGAGPVGCMPTGSVTTVAIKPPETPQPACRGARILTTFTGTTDTLFTCCGVSNGATPYAVTVSGERTAAAGDDLLLEVPQAAPLGVTSVSMTCSSGAVTPTIDFEVIDKAPPVVTSVDTAIFGNETLTVVGSNLQDVSQVTAIPVSGAGNLAPCFYGDGISATSISCTFDGIAPGDYYIAVNQEGCGYALNTPIVTIKKPVD